MPDRTRDTDTYEQAKCVCGGTIRRSVRPAGLEPPWQHMTFQRCPNPRPTSDVKVHGGEPALVQAIADRFRANPYGITLTYEQATVLASMAVEVIPATESNDG